MFNSLRQLKTQIWVLAAGFLLCQIGTGSTLFYAPIFFVNQVGMSAASVGLALGSASISGILGRFLGGTLSDSPRWGRKKTLLLSAAISLIGDLILSVTFNFPTLLLGNLFMGFGVGLYWPATEAAVADLTTPGERSEAFAIARLADSLGLGLGVVGGGILIANFGQYRALFLIDALSFLLFSIVVYITITDTKQLQQRQHETKEGWLIAARDRRLMTYICVNILFTTYISQTQSTLPLYFKNFVSNDGFSATIISGLFTWHIAFAALSQLPVARFLKRFSRINALGCSMILWGLGFSCIWLLGSATNYVLVLAILALSLLSLATVAYTSSASVLVVDIAPKSLWGIYLAINSQCWAIGYLIGPPLGGWALDQNPIIAQNFWLILALTVFIGLLILQFLNKMMTNS